MLINWICHTKSESYLFLYTSNHYYERFKSGFWGQNHLMNLCSIAVNSQKDGI